MKSLLLLHCKRREHSCLLLSRECLCNVSVVWVQWCKMCLCVCLHRKQMGKYILYNVCDRDTERKKRGEITLTNEEMLIV